MYQIEILPLAIQELDDAISWYEEQRKDLGQEMFEEIDSYLLRVKKNLTTLPSGSRRYSGSLI